MLLKDYQPGRKATVVQPVMVRHWLRPYWRADELDEWLATQEASGWRLVRVGFYRCFVFREAKPREVRYFSTYAFLKEAGLMDLGFQLKYAHKADELTPGFCGSLLLEHIYRINRPLDRETWLDFRQLRNAYLRHTAIQSILCSALILVLSATVLLFGGAASSNQAWWLVVSAALSAFSLGYHTFGWCFLKRRWNRYFR